MYVNATFHPSQASSGIQNTYVALNLTSVHDVLDCPKKNQATTYPACLITSTKVGKEIIVFLK